LLRVGHFLVAAFELLVRIRMHDEAFATRRLRRRAPRQPLRPELDARCTQIAAFNLALAAWKSTEAGGYRTLPSMHIACSGQAPKVSAKIGTGWQAGTSGCDSGWTCCTTCSRKPTTWEADRPTSGQGGALNGR